MDELNVGGLLVQVFGPQAAAWVAVVGVCLVVWSQLRAAIPQAWWEKLPRPLLLLLACSALLLVPHLTQSHGLLNLNGQRGRGTNLVESMSL